MYLRHFGLEKSAFSPSPDPSFLYLTARHREALAALLFAVAESKGFVVVTGDAGTGKTTLTRKLLSSLASTGSQFSVLVNPLLTQDEFFEAVLMGFGERHIPASKALRLALFRNLLLQIHQNGKSAVLVIDEAHLLSEELLEEIRLLSNFETSERKLLQIILIGQNELGSTLNHPSLRQLKQRIAIRVHINPLTEAEVAGYIEARWRLAGSSQPVPFTREAVQLVARCSAGVPRTVNIVCDAALVNAYGSGVRLIGTAEINEVIHDLDLQAATDAGSLLGRLPPAAPALPQETESARRIVIRPPADAARIIAEKSRPPGTGTDVEVFELVWGREQQELNEQNF